MSKTIQYHVPEHLVMRERAKRGERTVQTVALVLALFCILLASLFPAKIDAIRAEHNLTVDEETLRGLPPDIALLTKAGTFRAIAIDVLFMRLENLKQENKYFELDKLSSMICKLAPRFPSVWKYAAWNQAYNISVAQYTPEGRWYWVKNGINLLRLEGLRWNKKSVGLYLELAYIFWHKVGDFLDDQHWNYKKELAVEMERVLGPPPVTVNDQDIIANFAEIAHAPNNLESLIATDGAVAEYVEKLAELDLHPDLSLLEFVARNLRTQLQIRDVLRDVNEDTLRTLHQSRIELLSAPETLEPRDRLLACLRKVYLHELFNMDADWMLKLMEDYGPLDWRAPYMHAIYWSSKGDMETKGRLDLDENDSMNTVRFLLFGLALTIKRGKLVFDPDFDDPTRSYLELLPDSRFIPYLHQAYLKFGKEQFGDDPRFEEGTAGPNFKNGHFSMLEDGIRQLYIEGGSKNLKLAEKYYAYLRKYNREPNGSVQSRFQQPLEQFVMSEFYNSLVSFKRANMVLGAMILRSMKYLSLGDVEQSVNTMALVKKGWEYYMKDKYTDVGGSERRHLAPLPDMRADAAVQFLQIPEIDPLHKIRLWRRLELPTRQAAYDRLEPYFLELSEANDPPISAAKAFPEPPGMDEFRLQQQSKEQQKPNVDVDQGEKAW